MNNSTISHLQIIHTWAEFARERGMCFSDTHLENIAQWTKDAIALMKEQEERIKMLEHQLETITKWRANAGAFD